MLPRPPGLLFVPTRHMQLTTATVADSPLRVLSDFPDIESLILTRTKAAFTGLAGGDPFLLA